MTDPMFPKHCAATYYATIPTDSDRESMEIAKLLAATGLDAWARVNGRFVHVAPTKK